MSFNLPERLRVVPKGPVPFDPLHPDGGLFRTPGPVPGRTLHIVASRGAGWEHVSVSVIGKAKRTPTWPEMCFVKDLFWDPEDPVMQLHPPRSQWVNNFEGCLHLWRPIDREIPAPPAILVGSPGVSHEDMAAMSDAERWRYVAEATQKFMDSHKAHETHEEEVK